jgi:hypothetical protein
MGMVFSWRQCDEFTPVALTVCCPRCESSLSMHQPDSDLSDRLLATCDECKAWFLANADATILVPIPRTAPR